MKGEITMKKLLSLALTTVSVVSSALCVSACPVPIEDDILKPIESVPHISICNTGIPVIPYIPITKDTVISNNSTYINDSASDKKIKIKIGDSYLTAGSITNDFGTPTYIQSESDSAMLPLRAVSTAVAAIENGTSVNVNWNSNAKTAEINYGSNSISFEIGSNYITVNGNKTPIANNAFAEIRNDTTFVPLRALSEALDLNVDWDNTTRTVTLYK